jgi:hypothetical protein
MMISKGSFSKFAACALINVTLAINLHQPYQRLNCLALAEVVAEGHTETGTLVVFLEPIREQLFRHAGCTIITTFSPSIYLFVKLGDKQELARAAAGFHPSPSRGTGVFDKVGLRLLPWTTVWDIR